MNVKYRIKSNGCEFKVEVYNKEKIVEEWRKITKKFLWWEWEKEECVMCIKPGWEEIREHYIGFGYGYYHPTFHTIEKARARIHTLKIVEKAEKRLRECRKAGMEVIEIIEEGEPHDTC